MRETRQAPEGSDATVGAPGGELPSGSDDTQIRSFLIADVRGYTSFTQERGDEVATALVARFAEIVRERVEANEGSLIELRGDEALASFGSPRKAIRAAVELQSSMLDATRADPTLPLPVGIGIDAGEAVPLGDGYRGGALNLAARLCGEAGPGEILGSQSIVHLAGTLDGIHYLDRGEIQLKGLSGPGRVFSIASDAQDVSAQMTELLPPRPAGRATSGRLQFRILGPVEVGQGDRALSIGGPKQRAVLAHLLVRSNELISSESLVEAVWGDDAPGSSRSTLYTYVSHLRAVLGQDRIQSQAPGYRLRLEADELDAARFEQLLRDAEKAKAINPRVAAAVLDEALGLWRGPALDDVAVDGALLAEASRLNELRLGAGEERLEALLAAGDQPRVIPEAESLIDRHPLRERIWLQLMLALYRDGRQAEALNAYQRVREILADELGIDPSPEVVRLHEQILRQDPKLELRGEPLRGYRLLEKVDEGPTGVVFRATQPHVGRDVAVKIVHEHLASDPSFVRGFERDAQAIAALEHPHIVPVYDYWREPGQAYVVSRYLKEGSFRGLESRGARSGRARARLAVEQVATALAFAHARQVAHGNVGASNVLFDGEGNAYLGDFRAGVRFTQGAVEADIRGLASLARNALASGEIPRALAELIERAVAGSGSVTAAEFAAAVTERARAEAVPTPPEVALRNPYKGLRAFTEADTQDYFGRGELISHLLSRLAETGPRSRVLAVVGPSGGGKSSVVRAGVVPAIRNGALGDPEHVFVAEMFPGQHPIDELETALLRVSTHPTSRLPDLLAHGSRGLLDAMDLALPAPAELILVVDQFEEVFTLTTDEQEREVFLESLRVATADPDSRLRLIVTLRADFYDRPLVYPRFGEVLASATEVVAPLTPDETEQAIRQPAEGVGISVEPGLLAEIIADLAHQPGALPLLQYGLTELFEHREGDRLTLDAYREIGGVAGALSARAERIFDTASPEGKRTIRQVFLRLVTLGEGREDTRRRVTRTELDALDVDTEAIDRTVDMFGRHRLLTFDREPSMRAPTVEIAHEALLGAWDRLRTWIDEARDDLRQDRRLARAGGEWRGSGRDPSFLLRGARLQQLDAWASSTDLAIGQSEREYLKASLDQRDEELKQEEVRAARERALERRSTRRMRGLVGVLTVAALVAGTLTFVSVEQRRRAESASRSARDAETAQLAQRLGAQALIEGDLDLSLLLARQAVAVDDSLQTRSYLFADLLRTPVVAGVMRDQWTWSDSLRSIAVSPDGRTLAVGDAESGLLFFDARTYERIGEPIPVKRGVESVAFNPVSRTVAFGGNGYLRLIDADTREELASARIAPTDTGANRIAFSPDGSRLVVVIQSYSDRDRISVRDATTLAAIGPSLAPRGFQGAYVGSTWQAPGFALTPDGRSVVIATAQDELVWWALRSGRPTRRLSIRAGRHPLALSPDGRTAVVGVDGGLQFIDVRSGASEMADAPGGTPSWLLFGEDGGTVVSTSFDGSIALWDVRSARLRETLRGHSAAVMQPIYSPDEQTLYTASHDGTAIAWDVGGDRGVGRRFAFTEDPVPDPDYSGHPGTFSPDGRLIALGLREQGIELRDARVLTPVGLLRETGGEVKWLAFSPDGRTLVAMTVDGNGTVWDVESRSLRRAPFQTESGYSIGISADGTILATPADEFESGVKLWDAATGESIGTIADDVEVGHIAFSPAGPTLAIIHGLGKTSGTVELWDVIDRSRIATLPVDGRSDDLNIAMGFSSDGRLLATGGWFGIVRIWDVHTGELVRELDLGAAGAFTLDFGPGGRVLAVSGWSPAASLWDLATGAQIGQTFAAGSGRTMVDMSPDGHRLLLTHADGRGAIYDVDPESWAERACAIANRTLTREEWEEFLPGRPYEPACAT